MILAFRPQSDARAIIKPEPASLRLLLRNLQPDHLGIAAEMKVKLKTYEGAGLTQAIATDEVELGVTGMGPILAMPSAEFVGALPKEIQSYVVFIAGVATSAKDLAASRALLQFMTGSDAAPVFKAKGMDRD